MTARRCPSCEHTAAFHQPDGCWFSVTDARPQRDIGCPCGRLFGAQARANAKRDGAKGRKR